MQRGKINEYVRIPCEILPTYAQPAFNSFFLFLQDIPHNFDLLDHHLIHCENLHEQGAILTILLLHAIIIVPQPTSAIPDKYRFFHTRFPIQLMRNKKCTFQPTMITILL